LITPNSSRCEGHPRRSELAIIREAGRVDVAGETDRRKLGMLVTRNLLRNCRRLDERRVGHLPVGLDPHLFLDQAAEVEAAHDLLQDVELS
jgi:hypothetical protein